MYENSFDTAGPELRDHESRHLRNRPGLVSDLTSIADYLRQITQTNIEVVPNGVNVTHFRGEPAKPIEYRADDRAKVVFIGTLADWINTELIGSTAAICKDLSFYLIGPEYKRKLGSMPANVKWLGSRPYDEIPGYLAHADVAIAPFDVNGHKEFVESIDAIKLYECVAAGIPTVATRWRQSLDLEPFVIPTYMTSAPMGQI